MTPETTTTFVKWLQTRKANKEELEKYIQSLGEWFNSDYKVASNDDGSNIRKTVCAMANKRGGEVFIGVDDNGKVVGANCTNQQITQYLQQPNAKRGIWFITDLTEVVRKNTAVKFTKAKEKKQAFILEVQRPGIPVFTQEGRKMILYVRQGESSIPSDSHDSILWDRETNRELILRTCFLEFRTLYRRISSSFPEYLLGPGLRFPYLEKRMEDGLLYQFLTKQDLSTLLGESGQSSTYHPGIYSELFELKYDLNRLFSESKNYSDLYNKIRERLRRVESSREDKIQSFSNYLKQEGIYTSDLDTE